MAIWNPPVPAAQQASTLLLVANQAVTHAMLVITAAAQRLQHVFHAPKDPTPVPVAAPPAQSVLQARHTIMRLLLPSASARCAKVGPTHQKALLHATLVFLMQTSMWDTQVFQVNVGLD